MTNNGAVCAPSKVFRYPDKFPQVSRTIGHKNMEKVGKNEEISIFQATFVGLGELEKC